MSGLIDCALVVGKDLMTIGKIGAESAFTMAKMSMSNLASMSKDIGMVTVKGIGDAITAIKNIASEERKVYSKALEKYQEAILEDDKSVDAYLNKLLLDNRMVEFGVESSAFINNVAHLSNKEKCETINEVSSVVFTYDKINEALFELSKYSDVFEYDLQLKELKDETLDLINKGKYNLVNKESGKLSDLLKEIKKSMKVIMEENSRFDVEKINEIYIELENEVGEAYIYVFNNELSQLLQDTTDGDLDIKNQLLEVKKKVVDYAFKLNELEYIQGVSECQSMIEYVYNTLNDESISDELKLERISIRANALKDDYLKCELNNQRAFKVKEEFDRVYWLNSSYKKYLGLQIKEVPFDYKSANEIIKALEKENKELYTKCESKQKNEYIRKVIKEAMIENELEYLESREKDNGIHVISQDVFHIENGDVVTVTTNEKGEVNYIVGNANIDGMRNSQEGTVESMHKFCDKYKNIEKKLKESGIEVNESRRFDPSVKFIREVEISSDSKQVIKNSNRRRSSKELKRRHVGDE